MKIRFTRDSQSVAVVNVTWSQFHLAGALLGLAFLLYGFFVEWTNIQANLSVINEVMSEVKRVRAERGLDVECAPVSNESAKLP